MKSIRTLAARKKKGRLRMKRPPDGSLADLARLSHEIRTPLNVLLGVLDLALASAVNKEQQEYFALMQSAGKSLMTVVNDLLEFSRIESGELRLERIPFSLRALVEDTVAMLSFEAARKTLRVRSELSPGLPDQLIGDPARLRQVLVNLVANAIKFSETGEIVVGIQPQPAEAGEIGLCFSVADQGAGISADTVRQLFAPFHQADPSTWREHGGSGLGLSIVARLVALMRGKVWLESQPGHGSTFHFTAVFEAAPAALPPGGPAGARESADSSDDSSRAAAEEARADSACREKSRPETAKSPAARTQNPPGDDLAPAPARRPSTGPKATNEHARRHGPALELMLIEDNPMNRRFGEILLEQAGHRVVSFGDAARALPLLALWRPDAVLMDLHMPGMDGFAATAALRRDEGRRHQAPLPVIALTAHVDAAIEARCSEAGMDGCIVKPIDPAALATVLGRSSRPAPRRLQPATLDRRQLLQQVHGDLGLLREIRDLFMRDAPALLGRLHDSLASGDVGAFGHTAHVLRGMFHSLAAGLARSLADELEHLDPLAESERARQLCARLDGEVRRLKAALSRLVSQPPRNAPPMAYRPVPAARAARLARAQPRMALSAPLAPGGVARLAAAPAEPAWADAGREIPNYLSGRLFP